MKNPHRVHTGTLKELEALREENRQIRALLAYREWTPIEKLDELPDEESFQFILCDPNWNCFKNGYIAEDEDEEGNKTYDHVTIGVSKTDNFKPTHFKFVGWPGWEPVPSKGSQIPTLSEFNGRAGE